MESKFSKFVTFVLLVALATLVTLLLWNAGSAWTLAPQVTR